MSVLPLSRKWFSAVLAVIAASSGGVFAPAQAETAGGHGPTPVRTDPLPGPAAAQQPTTSTQAGIVSIESDRQQADNSTGVVTASGNVRIVYPDRRVLATARQAQYFSREARVVLSGDVRIVQEDGSRLLAEQVVYDVSLERLDARPLPGAQVVSIVRLKRHQDSGGGTSPLIPSPMGQPTR